MSVAQNTVAMVKRKHSFFFCSDELFFFVRKDKKRICIETLDPTEGEEKEMQPIRNFKVLKFVFPFDHTRVLNRRNHTRYL